MGEFIYSQNIYIYSNKGRKDSIYILMPLIFLLLPFSNYIIFNNVIMSPSFLSKTENHLYPYVIFPLLNPIENVLAVIQR